MNKFKNILVLIISIVVFPLTSLLLVGCGATAINQIKAVAFVSSLRNDKNEAVFELDLNSPVKLPYKLNPSSAYGYSPLFDVADGMFGANKENYTLDQFTGEFCIINEKFADVKVSISIGSFTDICQIKLKKYPTKVGVYDQNAEDGINISPKISLACNTAHQINAAGLLNNELKLLQDSNYNFLVEVDNDSKEIINLPDKNRLNIVTYNNYGLAKVRVAICDYYGNVIKDNKGNAMLAFEIEIAVYPTCEYMDVYLSGASQLLSSKKQQNNVAIDVKDLAVVDDYYIIDYDVDLHSQNMMINDDSIKISCSTDKTTYVSIDNEQKQIKISKVANDSTYNFTIRIRSSASMENKEFCTIAINITINY